MKIALDFDTFEKHAELILSGQSIKICEDFRELEEKYSSIQERYMNSFHDLYECALARVRYRRYSNGGLAIYRGFYTPDAADMVVGGANRGRLLKRMPPKNFNYEYLFDEDGRMVAVIKNTDLWGKKPWIESIELLIHSEDTTLGLVYEPFVENDYYLGGITECRYINGRLVRYENYLGVLGARGFFEVEIFGYSDDEFDSLMWYSYVPAIKSISIRKYEFSTDSEGYLSKYNVYLADKSVTLAPQPKIVPQKFDVLGKRKATDYHGQIRIAIDGINS